MAKRILVTGSLAYDLLLNYDGSFAQSLRPDSLESLSVSFFCPHFARHHGGTGVNVAWNLKLLGSDALLVAAVGYDGDEYVDILKKRGITTTHIERIEDAVTATAVIGSDSSEHQIAFFHPGADARSQWPDLQKEQKEIAYAIVGARDPHQMMRAVEWCFEQKIPVLFDPGQQTIAFGPDELKRLFKMSTVVIVNDFEWRTLCKTLRCDEETVLKYVPTLVATHGDQGFTVYSKKGVKGVRACTPKVVVNPTGAGDAFRAGVLAGLSAGWELLDACKLGAAMGSFNVEYEGTLLDSLDVSALFARAKETYGEALPELKY
jgi:adenosine kinase